MKTFILLCTAFFGAFVVGAYIIPAFTGILSGILVALFGG